MAGLIIYLMSIAVLSQTWVCPGGVWAWALFCTLGHMSALRCSFIHPSNKWWWGAFSVPGTMLGTTSIKTEKSSPSWSLCSRRGERKCTHPSFCLMEKNKAGRKVGDQGKSHGEDKWRQEGGEGQARWMSREGRAGGRVTGGSWGALRGPQHLTLAPDVVGSCRGLSRGLTGSGIYSVTLCTFYISRVSNLGPHSMFHIIA